MPEHERNTLVVGAKEEPQPVVRLRLGALGVTGLELSPETVPKTPVLETEGTESGTPSVESPDVCSALHRLVDLWPVLPQVVRSTILHLAESASDASEHPGPQNYTATKGMN
jgi:hypothetical protein